MTPKNPFAVLRGIGSHPDQFRSLESAVAKAASDLVLKRLKLKSMTVDDVRAVRDAIGEGNFDEFVQAISAANIKSILGKLDKHHSELKTAGDGWRRQRLLDLASGGTDPAQKTAKAKKAKSSPKTSEASKPAIGFGTETMRAFRESLKKN